jgi:glycosidase
MNDPHSMLSLYRRLIQIRKSTPALTEGSYRALDSAPEDCLVFHRDTPAQHLVVALNFSAEPREIDLPAGKILLSTLAARPAQPTKSPLTLGPNEAVIMEIKG